MVLSSGAIASACLYMRRASLRFPSRAINVASSAIFRASSAFASCADKAQGRNMSKRKKLRFLAIAVLDVPADRFQKIDSSEHPDRGEYASGYCQKEPVERWIDDADRIVADDVFVVLRIQPRTARQLQQTERIDQHAPEVGNRR